MIVHMPPRTSAHRVGRGLANLAGAAGIAVLVAAAILAIGIPVAILVRVIGGAIGWLLM